MAATVSGSEYVKFEADKIFLYALQSMSDYPGLQQNAHLDIVKDTFGNLVLQMRTWCLAGRIPTRVENKTIRWPDGVWQTFKKKFMPRWFVDRFPVKWESVDVPIETHHYFVCPHIVTGDHAQHVQFMATGTEMARYFRGR